MTIPPYDDRPPQSEKLTAYDERHLVTYLRLLDAADEGADWREVISVIFQLDAAHEPQRAKLVYDSHLERARWVSQSAYRDLLRPPN